MDTQTTNDINDALGSNFMLVTLSQSRWSARKPDKNLAIELATQHGATPEAVTAAKNIMAGANTEMRAVEKAMNAMRTYLYSVSVPWSTAGDDDAKRGPRMIPTTRSLEIITHLKELQDEFDTALGEFELVYDQRVQEALRNQGNMADATHYPDKSRLRDMFKVSLDFQPVPTMADFSRMSLPTQAVEGLATRMAGRQERAVHNALADLHSKIVETTSNMAEQLSKHASGEKTKLYVSLVDNVTNLTEVLRSSNFINDPALDDLANKMAELTVLDIKQLKANPGAAGEVAAKAKQVADAARQFGMVPARAVTPEAQPSQAPEDNSQLELPLDEAPDQTNATPSAEVVDINSYTDPETGMVLEEVEQEEEETAQDEEIDDILKDVDTWF